MITQAYFNTFLFVLLRFTGWIVISPVFGRKNIPVLLKMGLSLLLSVLVMMLLPYQNNAELNMFGFFLNAVKEILFGMLLGYINHLLFHLAVCAGQIIDMQIGFGMSNFFDQQLGIQIPLTGNLLNALMILLFFSVNGHHILIGLMFNSFKLIKPGNIIFGELLIRQLIDYFLWFFILAVKISMPIIAVSVILEFGLGIIIKTMPQMNMFVVGIPLKLILGILSMIIFLSTFVYIIEIGFDKMFLFYQKIIEGMILE